MPSAVLNAVIVAPVELAELLIVLDGILLKIVFDTGWSFALFLIQCTISNFKHKKLKYSNLMLQSAQVSICVNKRVTDCMLKFILLKLYGNFR